MKKTHKIFIILGVLLLIIAGVVIYLNYYLKSEIVEALENQTTTSDISYDDISINVLGGSATIKNVKLREGTFTLESREINLDDFSYQDYLQDKDITIGSLQLLDPEIVINKSDSTGKDGTTSGDLGNRIITVRKFSVLGGSLRMIKNDTASNSVYSSLQGINIENLVIGELEQNAPLPFSYETINVESDSLFFELNDTHDLHAEFFSLKNKDLTIENFSITPQFAKEFFDQRIPYEQDWMALKVETIDLNEFEWDKIDEQIHFTVPFTSIQNAHFEIYRNKKLKDDTRIKPMYSQLLRELETKIQLDSVSISNSYIEYQENVLDTRQPGKLSFHNINAEIKNITNKNLNSQEFPTTRLEAQALFMGETELTLNWEFDVSNELDEFHVQGSLGTIRAENINSFLVPTMNVEAEGNIESLYYNFYGNRDRASGNMQLAYRDFKINILKDGEQESKSFLSGLANLIIKNDRVNEDVEQEDITVSRDKTKSFWNFFWSLIREGALKTFL